MVFRFMESRESSDNLLVSGCPGYDNDQEQDAVTIPIKSRIPSVVEGYTKENGVTVVNFNKSKQIVCEICSLTLKSMKCLEKHKKARHSDDDTCFYCSECGTLIRCMFYFLRQKNKVGSACKFSFVTRDSVLVKVHCPVHGLDPGRNSGAQNSVSNSQKKGPGETL